MAVLLARALIIIAPTAPPEVCGVSDYAYKVAAELTKSYDKVVIGVERLPIVTSESAGIQVEHWSLLLAQAIATSQPTDVLFNYTPMSYARSGLPTQLLLALYRFVRANPENRLFVFVHETWNESFKLRIDQIVRQRLARWTMQRIGKMASGLAVATTGQQHKLNALLGRENVHLFPVGSNIIPLQADAGLASERQPGSWLVFGLPHTRLWALEANLPLLKAMCQKGALRRIYAVGPVDAVYAQQEKTLIAQNIGVDILVQVGVLTAAEVSAQMLGAEAALLGMSADGIKKSGTFSALAAHAVPIICEAETQVGQLPYAALLRPDELLANPTFMASAEGERRRRLLHNWFWSTRSWEVIGQHIGAWLQSAA